METTAGEETVPRELAAVQALVNTVDQALTALDGLLGPALGLALDTYHLNIEERSSADAVRTAIADARKGALANTSIASSNLRWRR